jgi:hypothetical protein
MGSKETGRSNGWHQPELADERTGLTVTQILAKKRQLAEIVPMHRIAAMEWENLDAQEIDYPAGYSYSPVLGRYRYEAGRRLIIRGEHVMDTCEKPYCEANSDLAFRTLRTLYPKRNRGFTVIDIGAGLRINSSLAAEKLRNIEGKHELIIIELNKKIYEETVEWAEKEKADHPESNLTIRVIQGDALDVLEQLAEEGVRAHMANIDAFPLVREEAGFNDFMFFEPLKKVLKKRCVVSVFPFYKGSRREFSGMVTPEQEQFLLDHFKGISKEKATVKPPPDYKYLQTPEGPIVELPVVVAYGKK